MLFRSGNPNLHDTTRRRAGDPDREADGALFPDLEVDDEIRISATELFRRAKSLGERWGVAFQYVDSVADQVWYPMPDNLDTDLSLIEVEGTGKNIETDSSAAPVALTRGGNQEWLAYAQGDTTEATHWILGEEGGVTKYGIIAPLSVTGTKAIRLSLEVESPTLSADTDKPHGVPTSHHELICLLAARTLRTGRDLDVRDLDTIIARQYPEYIEDMGSRFGENNASQIPCAGRTRLTYHTTHGFAIKN